MVLCKKEFAKKIDKSVFPGLQGGPHMNAVAAIAITLAKAQTAEFKQYAHQVLNKFEDARAGVDGSAGISCDRRY